MSSRQVVFLLTCLLGLVWAAPVIEAQGPATLDRNEPAPLQKRGFIQQLRALPEASVQVLQEAEDRQFRLPPRSNLSRESEGQTNPVRQAQVTMRVPSVASQNAPPGRDYNLPAQPTGRATLQHTHESPWVERMNQREPTPAQMARAPQSMPPTYRGLQNRPVNSYQLVEEPSRISDQRETRAESTDDREFVRHGFSDADSNADLAKPFVGRITDNRNVEEQFSETVDRRTLDKPSKGPIPFRMSSARERPDSELKLPEEPKNDAFEALTSGSLQRAPRVSRVPLPRPAATANSSLQAKSLSDDERVADAPARIVATPTSTTPHLDSTRFSTATLKSSISDIGPTTKLNSGSAFRLSEKALPSPTMTGPPLPALPSTLPSPALPSSLPAIAADLPSTNRQSLSDRTPEKFELSLPSSDPTSLDSALPAAPAPTITAPKFASPTITSPTITSPTITSPTITSPTITSPTIAGPTIAGPTITSPTITGPAAKSPSSLSHPTSRSHHMPRLVSEGTPDRPRSASPDQRLRMEAPRIEVVLNGPSDLPIGVPAQYEIVVRNEDSIDLQGLILRMDIPRGVKVNTLKPTHGQFELELAPDGLTMVTWGFEHLTAGQTASAPMQLVAGSAQNFAVAMEWTLMPIAGTSAIDVRTPRLELALDGPAEVRFGQPNTYRLHIRNPGNAAANHVAVRLSAEPFGSSAAEIEHIAPGEEEVIEVELTFNERGSINIAALAEEQSGLASKTAIAVIVRQAVVKSQLLATPLAYHGTPTECRVRLSNSGDADALDLRASLQLPEGAGLVSAPPGAVLNGRELTWRVDKLIAGSSEEFTVQLKLTADGSNAFTLQCGGPGNVNTTAAAVTRVESITDLKLFVNDPIAPAPVGSEVVYELTLTNRGSKAATNIKVIAQFSDGIEPIRGEGHAARVVPGQTLFEPLPRLAAGETVKLKVFAKAAASGTHRFRVEVRADESEVRLVQEESTQYLEPISQLAAPIMENSTLR